jgi:hypothetical protein
MKRREHPQADASGLPGSFARQLERIAFGQPESINTSFSRAISISHTRHYGPSVVPLRGELLTPKTRGSALLQALQDCASELMLGAIVGLDCSSPPRAKVLPLHTSR